MTTIWKLLSVSSLAILLAMGTAMGVADEIAEVPAEGLDEQVQAIKKEVLRISAELNQMQEKLMYPSDTQIALFITLAQGDTFHLGAVKINIDGKNVTNYVYSPQELEALHHGGVQRIYTGNIMGGTHSLDVEVIGKSAANPNYQLNTSHKFYKMKGPKVIQITLSGSGSTIQSIAD